MYLSICKKPACWSSLNFHQVQAKIFGIEKTIVQSSANPPRDDVGKAIINNSQNHHTWVQFSIHSQIAWVLYIPSNYG